MEFNTNITVDLDDVQQFIEGEDFIQFLLNKTTEFSTAAYIFQKLEEAVRTDKGEK